MGRQILRGLQYLHSMDPAITHGDLRCDKIYVNGHSGEIKIGDLGLATLMPYRSDVAGAQALLPPLNSSSDIFAFGLCILELLTLKQMDPQHCAEWPQVVAEVNDDEARAFITKCLEPTRPDAVTLLEDPFLSSRPFPNSAQDGLPQGQDVLHTSSKDLADAIVVAKERRSQDEVGEEPESESTDRSVAVGKLKGEDYVFEFAGKVMFADDALIHFPQGASIHRVC